MSDALSNNSIFRALANRFASAGGLLLSPKLGARSMTRIALSSSPSRLSGRRLRRDKPQVTAGQTLSEEELKQKCADQQWREKRSRDLVRRVPAAGRLVGRAPRAVRIS